jgi:hypothetical protein
MLLTGLCATAAPRARITPISSLLVWTQWESSQPGSSTPSRSKRSTTPAAPSARTRATTARFSAQCVVTGTPCSRATRLIAWTSFVEALIGGVLGPSIRLRRGRPANRRRNASEARAAASGVSAVSCGTRSPESMLVRATTARIPASCRPSMVAAGCSSDGWTKWCSSRVVTPPRSDSSAPSRAAVRQSSGAIARPTP